jgi:membrane-bound metal-dependent hydrolase YbcI (DUF457 family)
MDPVSHAALGRTLVAALGPRDSGRVLRGSVAAGVLGALAPDLDSALMPFGWDRYLRFHEVGLHTAIGTVACALLTAAVVWSVVRGAFGRLAFCAWLGGCSHVLLDLLSSARLRPGWPIVDTVVSLPAVAMADPWLLAICLAGALVSWAGRARRTPALVLGVASLFVLLKGAAGALAFSNYSTAVQRAGEPVVARAIEAEWASLTRWRVLDRTPARLRIWRAAAGEDASVALSWPIDQDHAAVSASRQMSTVRNFLRAHQLGFAAVHPQADGRTLVLWSDIRFCWNPDVPGAAQLEPIGQSRTGERIACALWFGGELDAAGRAVREIVKVAGFTQTR